MKNNVILNLLNGFIFNLVFWLQKLCNPRITERQPETGTLNRFIQRFVTVDSVYGAQ